MQSLTHDESRNKALRRLEEYVNRWLRTYKLMKPDKKRLEMDFYRGVWQQHSDIEDFFIHLREHFERIEEPKTSITIKCGNYDALQLESRPTSRCSRSQCLLRGP